MNYVLRFWKHPFLSFSSLNPPLFLIVTPLFQHHTFLSSLLGALLSSLPCFMLSTNQVDWFYASSYQVEQPLSINIACHLSVRRPVHGRESWEIQFSCFFEVHTESTWCAFYETVFNHDLCSPVNHIWAVIMCLCQSGDQSNLQTNVWQETTRTHPIVVIQWKPCLPNQMYLHKLHTTSKAKE